MKKTCSECRSAFDVKPSHAAKRRTCSKRCYAASLRTKTGASNPNWKGGPVAIVCEWCSCSFSVRPATAGRRRFCSRTCRTSWDATRVGPASPKWTGGRKKTAPKPRKPARVWTCIACGRIVARRSKRCAPCRAAVPRRMRRIACVGCQKPIVSYQPKQTHCIHCLDRTGARNPRWEGGITTENSKLRKTREYRAWREAVFVRDRFTCQHCGQRGGTLHADHIKPFCAFPELRFDVSNGRTLCVACHRKTPTFLSGARRIKRARSAARSAA